jgi:hypothetical protein
MHKNSRICSARDNVYPHGKESDIAGSCISDVNQEGENRPGSPDFCLLLCPVTRGAELYKVSLPITSHYHHPN